jgi:hypothetical protein
MRALPLQEPPGPGWSSLLDDGGVVISSLGEKYVDIALASAAWRPPPTRKEVSERLAKIEEQAAALLDSVRRLDGTTVDALHLAMKARNDRLRASASMSIDPPPKALGDITERLEALKNAAGIAEIPAASKVRRGPDQKWDAREIAKEAARDYKFLTGNPPTRSENRDGFPVFLTAIFGALGKRNDSVESFAREACEWWNRREPCSDDLTAIEKILANAPRALEE